MTPKQGARNQQEAGRPLVEDEQAKKVEKRSVSLDVLAENERSEEKSARPRPRSGCGSSDGRGKSAETYESKTIPTNCNVN